MSRTTPLPALRTSRAARLLLAGAVGATTLAGVGAASADDANPWALTAAGPAYLSTVNPGKVTLSGKGFTAGSVVTFTHCAADDTTEVPASDPRMEKKGTRLVVVPPVCLAGKKPRIKVVTDGVTASTRRLYTSKITYVEKPVLAAVSPVAPALGPWTGGTTATVTLQSAPVAKAAVQVELSSGSTKKRVSAKVSADDPTTFVFKTPALTPGPATAQVLVFGIPSEPVASAFDYLSTVKVSPNAWVAGTPAPTVKVTGAGFGANPTAITVTVCGVTVAPDALKTVTDKAITFTPPALSATPLPAGGGPCTVVVTVAGGRTSQVTAGSTFTYAAY